jgi:hypothetical protein
VYELRQYTLRPGARRAFVALFDAELVESQENAGMLVLGQFTDLDRPDVFVWVRGFRDSEAVAVRVEVSDQSWMSSTGVIRVESLRSRRRGCCRQLPGAHVVARSTVQN